MIPARPEAFPGSYSSTALACLSQCRVVRRLAVHDVQTAAGISRAVARPSRTTEATVVDAVYKACCLWLMADSGRSGATGSPVHRARRGERALSSYELWFSAARAQTRILCFASRNLLPTPHSSLRYHLAPSALHAHHHPPPSPPLPLLLICRHLSLAFSREPPRRISHRHFVQPRLSCRAAPTCMCAPDHCPGAPFADDRPPSSSVIHALDNGNHRIGRPCQRQLRAARLREQLLDRCLQLHTRPAAHQPTRTASTGLRDSQGRSWLVLCRAVLHHPEQEPGPPLRRCLPVPCDANGTRLTPMAAFLQQALPVRFWC